jgi:hypothetical protein
MLTPCASRIFCRLGKPDIVDYFGRLLDALSDQIFLLEEGIKDGQHMLPIGQHALVEVAVGGFAFGVPVPPHDDVSRNINVPANLIRGMAAKEKPVEKGSFALRETQFLLAIHRCRTLER